MANCFSKINEAKIKQIYNDAVDFMMQSDCFSNDCLIFYPPLREACPMPSMNNHFGCLGCGGCGYVERETNEIVRLRVFSGGRFSFNKQSFQKLGLNIEKAEGEILTLGYLEDAPKLESCNYIKFFTDSSIADFKYTLATKPQPYGFGRDRHMYCFWNKDNDA